jgi:hypothetical protein
MNLPKISQPNTVIPATEVATARSFSSSIGLSRQRPEKSSVVDAVPGTAASGLSRTACTSVRQYDGRSASRLSSSATTSGPAWPLVGSPDSTTAAATAAASAASICSSTSALVPKCRCTSAWLTPARAAISRTEKPSGPRSATSALVADSTADRTWSRPRGLEGVEDFVTREVYPRL